jgi:peptide/nickel transport system substrate-binding protein
MATLALLVVIVAGAGVGQSALGGSSQSDTLVDGTTDSITNIDPAGAYDYGTFTLESNFFEHLLDFRHGAKLEPSLATKCFSVGGLTTWRCNLRKGVTFSDGSAFDSTDVKFSFDRVTNKTIVKEAASNSPSSLLGNLKSVSTNGKYAVTFRLKTPQVTWPSILATQAGFIVPSDTYEPNHLRGNTEEQIGTGPYVLTKYTPGQQAVLTRNNDYWGTPAKTDNLIIRYYSKSSTMKLAIQRGEIDMSYQSFTPTEITSLQKQKGLRVYTGPGGRIRYLVMNVVREPATTSPFGVRSRTSCRVRRSPRAYHGQVEALFLQVPSGYPGHIGRIRRPLRTDSESCEG